MKKTLDNARKRADIPTVSKQQFIAEYAAAVTAEWPNWPFSVTEAGRNIHAIIAGWKRPSVLIATLARQHGAKRGRVGNFLRGLQ